MSISEQDRFLSLQTLLVFLILNGTAKTELDKQLEDNSSKLNSMRTVPDIIKKFFQCFPPKTMKSVKSMDHRRYRFKLHIFFDVISFWANCNF